MKPPKKYIFPDSKIFLSIDRELFEWRFNQFCPVIEEYYPLWSVEGGFHLQILDLPMNIGVGQVFLGTLIEEALPCTLVIGPNEAIQKIFNETRKRLRAESNTKNEQN